MVRNLWPDADLELHADNLELLSETHWKSSQTVLFCAAASFSPHAAIRNIDLVPPSSDCGRVAARGHSLWVGGLVPASLVCVSVCLSGVPLLRTVERQSRAGCLKGITGARVAFSSILFIMFIHRNRMKSLPTNQPQVRKGISGMTQWHTVNLFWQQNAEANPHFNLYCPQKWTSSPFQSDLAWRGELLKAAGTSKRRGQQTFLIFHVLF